MSTIRQRLTRRLLFGGALLLLTGAGIAYLIARTALTREFDNALDTKALALTTLIEQDKGNLVVDFGDQFMHEFDSGNSTAFFELWDMDGNAIARSDSLRGENLPQRYGPNGWDLTVPSGVKARAMGMRFKPHPADEKKAAAPLEAVLVVAASRSDLDRALATLGAVLAGSSLLVLTLTAAGVPWLLRRELAPLDRLADQAQRISAESLGERFPTDGLPAELAPISARLNDLLQRLQTSFTRERQFSDDLAHEFRTPIAELRSLAELSLKWPDARADDADRNVLAIAQQMEAIITRLLAIARSNQGQTAVEPQRVALAPLVAAVCQPLQARAASRQLAIQTDVSASLEVQSDPVLLRSIVTNLLDNAIEYSRSGGSVRIQSQAQNGHFALQVTNPVDQLNAEDVPHLFERFWRKDSARSASEHSGLGLPLARAFATSLGCSLTATLNGDECLTMTLSGPTEANHKKAE